MSPDPDNLDPDDAEAALPESACVHSLPSGNSHNDVVDVEKGVTLPDGSAATNAPYRRKKAAYRPRPLTTLLSRQDSAGSSDDEAMFVAVSCADCGDLFPTRKELLLHRLDAHTDRRPHQCPACMASFWQADLLRQHARTHTQDTPHACTQCGLRFTLRTHVAAHARALHSQRPAHQEHRCSVCTDKVFQTSTKLADHMRDHFEERPFICQTCQGTFRSRSTLYRHNKKHHPAPV